MSPLLLHGNTNQCNINGLLCTYTEMFRIQTCCNHILSAAEGFRGQEATCANPGFLSVLFSPQLILQFTEGVQWFYCWENFTYTLPRIQMGPLFSRGGGVSNFFPGDGGGGPNASFFRIVSEYDQEIPQSQTADNPVAPRGRAAQPSQDTRKTN